MVRITINSVNVKNNIITNLDVDINFNIKKDNLKDVTISKDEILELIKSIRDSNVGVIIETKDGKRVHVVADKYLRTNMDNNTDNNLSDLIEFSIN